MFLLNAWIVVWYIFNMCIIALEIMFAIWVCSAMFSVIWFISPTEILLRLWHFRMFVIAIMVFCLYCCLFVYLWRTGALWCVWSLLLCWCLLAYFWQVWLLGLETNINTYNIMYRKEINLMIPFCWTLVQNIEKGNFKPTKMRINRTNYI